MNRMCQRGRGRRGGKGMKDMEKMMELGEKMCGVGKGVGEDWGK